MGCVINAAWERMCPDRHDVFNKGKAQRCERHTAQGLGRTHVTTVSHCLFYLQRDKQYKVLFFECSEIVLKYPWVKFSSLLLLSYLYISIIMAVSGSAVKNYPVFTQGLFFLSKPVLSNLSIQPSLLSFNNNSIHRSKTKMKENTL